MTEQEKSVLEDFLQHIDCLEELSRWNEDHFNVFDILKISRNEIRHSNVLAWLFNANANHNLGDSFFSAVLSRILADDRKNYDKMQALLLDLYSFEVKRESDNIDLLLISESEKYVIVIENKVGTGEHSNQLNRYRENIEKKYPDSEKIFVFLTPGNQRVSDKENWTELNYQTIYDSLTEAMGKREVSAQVKYFLNQYLEILRRDVMEDQQLKDICNKIYRKYKSAIDLIVSHSDMDSMKGQMLSGIKKALEEYSKEKKILYTDGLIFWTREMNEVAPDFEQSVSSWNNTKMYQNWFEVWDNNIIIHLELGGKNLSPEQDNIVDRLMELTKPHTKSKPFVWKRLINFKKQLPDTENNVEENSYIIAKTLLDKLLEAEHDIYNSLKSEMNDIEIS